MNPETLKLAQQKDPTLHYVRRRVENLEQVVTGKHNTATFLYKKGLMYRYFCSPTFNLGRTTKQLVVPLELRTEVMRLGHDSILAGH